VSVYCEADAESAAIVADCPAGEVCNATAEATAGVAHCSEECVADSNAFASATDGATNALASGVATAINNSNASNNNTAIAEGTYNVVEIVNAGAGNVEGCVVGNEAACFVEETTTFGSSAVATGDAIAVNNSNATQSSTALATNGVANSDANALACVTPVTFTPAGSGCDATAHSLADANKGTAVSSADAIAMNGGVAYANSAQTANGEPSPDNTLNAAAGGNAIAIAEGANNVAIANSVGNAGAGSTTTTSAMAGSAVNTGQFGIGVSKSVSCAAGQETCGTGMGIALAQSNEGGIAISDAQTNAVNGQNATSVVGAAAGSSCAGPATASFTPNPDGSFSYSSSFNSGFGCTSAATSTSP
jgi:hypothetical protein